MKEIKTDKGFLVMQVSRKELMDALGEMTLGRCDFCFDEPNDGYYVAVLNQWLCKDCYDKWLANAEYYPEDAKVEIRNYNYYKKLFYEGED
jgi:hypothetical protein